MKQTLILVAALLAMSIVACKKDRTCTCTHTHKNFTGTTTSPNEVTTYKKIKKSDAKRLCQNTAIKDSSVTVDEAGGRWGEYTYDTYDCKLK